jgi:hypothetical protein
MGTDPAVLGLPVRAVTTGTCQSEADSSTSASQGRRCSALRLWVQNPVQILAFSLCKRDYVGVAQQIIEQLIDEELDKRAFIEILIRRILNKELSELNPRALHQRAKDAGAVWWLPRGCIRRRRQVCEP